MINNKKVKYNTLALGNKSHRQKVARETGRIPKQPIRKRPVQVTPDCIQEWELSDRTPYYKQGWWRKTWFNNKKSQGVQKIADYLEERGEEWSTTSQIRKAVGSIASKPSIYYYLNTLKKWGYVDSKKVNRREAQQVFGILGGDYKHLNVWRINQGILLKEQMKKQKEKESVSVPRRRVFAGSDRLGNLRTVRAGSS